MARGGRRTGTPGKSYSNRSDLHQPVKVAPGETYGQRKVLESQLKTMPLPDTQQVPPVSPPAPGGGVGALMGGAPAPALPGQLPFARPTERPDEPVTAGLPTGPGAGPEIMGGGPAQDQIGMQLRQLYQANPSNDLLRLIELHDNGY